ncbi:choice-of-anchor L domain-containing protein [Ornithinimicrobium sediminis]|uniref:choice-of-anchor L domain-containing protein n=1 Tax=Ornithinimicrobium sediminis TaxID=2904603 RepID=UPI002FCD87EC
MAESLVGPGVTVSGMTYIGNAGAAGTFAGGLPSAGFDTGVVMSSGAISNTVGSNNVSESTTTIFGAPGDSDLDVLIPQTTNDAAVLEFDFTADADTVFFQYVFGSDEYLEYVNSTYNDVFAFFVNGVNCATVPDPADPTLTAPVAVNTINPGANAVLYRDNPVASPSVLSTELDGLTVPLTCMAAVNPAPATNTMKLAIADASDSSLDSAVFLAEGSLSTTPPEGTGKVTGGGRLDVDGGSVTLGTVAIQDEQGLRGNLQVNDHRDGNRFHGYSVDSLVVTDTTATWSGSSKLNGQDGYTFEATVVDNRNGNAAKKGDPDTVAITVYDGEGAEVWSLSATDLTRGNITVHTEE